MAHESLIIAMLGIIISLLSVVAGLAGWKLGDLSKKVDELMVHRAGCIVQFANAENNRNEHRRIWEELESQRDSDCEHETRLTALEVQCRMCGKKP